MDRQSSLHAGARVELPSSVRLPDLADIIGRQRARFSPLASLYLGLVGFTSCGVVLVATASLLALYIP